MHWVLLPFFLIRLVLTISPFLLKLGWNQVSARASLVLALLLLAWVALNVAINAPISPTRPIKFSIPLAPYSPIPSSEQLERARFFWEQWRQLQPTHRDVLYNLSQVLRHFPTQSAAADEALLQAKNSDPNAEIFLKKD